MLAEDGQMGSILWQYLGPKVRGWEESPSRQPLVGAGHSGSRLLVAGRAAPILEQ